MSGQTSRRVTGVTGTRVPPSGYESAPGHIRLVPSCGSIFSNHWITCVPAPRLSLAS
jgi:hypothetical protein